MLDKLADPVCHPAHYEVYPVQPIEITRYLGFCLGNVVKYVLRAPWKGGVEDCDKALEYLRHEQKIPQRPLLFFAYIDVRTMCDRLRMFLRHSPGDKLWEDIAYFQSDFIESLGSYIFSLDISRTSVDSRMSHLIREEIACHIRGLRKVLHLRDTAGQIYDGMTGLPNAGGSGE